MTVAVVIPFASADPLRQRALEYVQEFYRDEFPDWRVYRLGAQHHSFSRSRAVNLAVDLTVEDILLINDGDTLCRPEQVRRAVDYAIGAPGLVYAYDRYRRLSQAATERLEEWRDVFHGEVEWQIENAVSQGCVAIRRSCFEQAGGYDERFTDWGYEDMEMCLRCERYWPTRRIPGDLYHIWHGERREDDSPVTSDPARVAANWRLFQKLTA